MLAEFVKQTVPVSAKKKSALNLGCWVIWKLYSRSLKGEINFRFQLFFRVVNDAWSILPAQREYFQYSLIHGTK